MTAAALGDKKRNASAGVLQGECRPNKYRLRARSQMLLPGFAVRRCQCRIAHGHDAAHIYRDHESARLVGAVYCNSVWTCPVCAPRLAERRAREVQAAINRGMLHGYGVALVTLTFAHGLGDQLADTLATWRAAQRRLKSGRAYAAFRDRWGVLGEVRALEVTHGENGWHPHSHAIVYTRAPMDAEACARFRAELFDLWLAACSVKGLGLPNEAHGVDVAPARNAAEYVAKWGFATEVARAPSKAGKHGRTPWELLAAADGGDKRAAWLYREFAQAFKGHRQLFWSHGLRQALDFGEELTDQEQLALEVPGELVASIDHIDLALIHENRCMERVLDLAMDGRAPVEAYLRSLRTRLPPAAMYPVLARDPVAVPVLLGAPRPAVRGYERPWVAHVR